MAAHFDPSTERVEPTCERWWADASDRLKAQVPAAAADVRPEADAYGRLRPARADAPADSRPPAAGRRQIPQWCAIMLAREDRTGEFRVVVLESGGHRRVVARSSSFRVPRVRAIPNRGKPRAEHERLVAELVGCGWRRVQTNGRWHDTAFTRPAPDPTVLPVRRVVIGYRRDRRAAHFVAEEVDSFGNCALVASSPPFALERRASPLEPSDAARAAHEALLDGLLTAGWTPAEAGGPEWYGHVLHKSSV